MTSTRDITIQAGETKEIIGDDRADMAYICEVKDAPIRIGHQRRYAKDGSTLTAGQTHTLSNLRGEALYAYAHESAATVRLNRAAADIDSQPEKEVSVIDGDVTISASQLDTMVEQLDEIGDKLDKIEDNTGGAE